VALSSVEAVLEKVWESLHTGSWADASHGMRKLYSHASLLKVSSSYVFIGNNENDISTPSRPVRFNNNKIYFIILFIKKY